MQNTTTKYKNQLFTFSFVTLSMPNGPPSKFSPQSFTLEVCPPPTLALLAWNEVSEFK